MAELRKRFTKWYVRKGYKYYFDRDLIVYFKCPWWVQPFARIFFSPSVYFAEKYAWDFVNGFKG